jgi:hypothetical protein
MKALPVLILFFAAVAFADDFSTIDGREYKDVTVSRVEPDGIVLKSKSGISKVYFIELSPEVQKRFHYAAASTAAYPAEQAASRAAFQNQQAQLPSLLPVEETKDKITDEIWQFRLKTRALYNASKFDELEALAAQIRTERGRLGDGSWKIYQFYESLGCRSDESESMWQVHARIQQNWDAAKPRSITAHVAHADFLSDYAWHARGTGFAKTVTKEGWRLFSERLAKAEQLLDESADFEPKCPMWWLVRMTVARGQDWSWDDYERLFQEAKAFEPGFWSYDVAKATYLLPRWHGQPGEWEYALTLDINRPNGLGLETYARVVYALNTYYKNIFRETHASWPQAREGFELMRQRYPDSLEILSGYCRLACLAEDRVVARKLFDELRGRMIANIWGDQKNFQNYRQWAFNR